MKIFNTFWFSTPAAGLTLPPVWHNIPYYMKTKHLALLALGMILMVIGGQVPYLAVDFRLRETIWSLRSLVEILPWLEGSLFAIVGLAVILRVFRQNQPPGIRFRNALILSLLAYAFFPLSMNGAVLTLSMLVSVSGFAVAAQGLGSRNRLAAHPRTLGSAGSGSLLLRPGRSAWISSLLIAGLGLNLVVAGIVFDFRPCIIDTLDQVFQARVFLTGQLTAPAPPVPRAFEFLYMIIRDGHWYSQYPPGHPLMLALGLVIGGSWMIGPLLGALLPVLLYATGRAIWNERTGRMAGLIGLAAPYLHLMAGSHMSHSTCAFFLLLGAFGLVRLLRGGGLGSALITATGFGYALWTRPYPALAVSLAAALGCLLTLGSVRRIRWPYAFLALVGATLPVCLLLLYNWKTNGHPLVFGYNITQGPLHRLGFGLRRMNETVRVFTLWEALKQTGYHLNGLNVFALGTALPATWLVVLPFLARRRHPFLGLVSLLAAAPVIAFFFYPFTDFVLGPRLVFTALPFGVLLAARGLVCLPRTGPRMRALAARPAVVFLLFLPVIPNLIGAMDFNRRLFRRSHDRIASFLSTHPVDRALVLCDDAIFSQYGFGQLRPGLPPDRPVFARDVHSADLVGHFADRPAFRFAYDSAGCLALEKTRRTGCGSLRPDCKRPPVRPGGSGHADRHPRSHAGFAPGRNTQAALRFSHARFRDRGSADPSGRLPSVQCHCPSGCLGTGIQRGHISVDPAPGWSI